MSIEKMQVVNFQRHRDLTVEFDERITTIIGDTDTGKSSLMRALRWLSSNRPAGDSFVRRGSDGAMVRARVDGQTIRRSRSGSDNVYALGKGEYRAFGSGVPEDVARLLKITELNFQGQHDAPFWFDLSPPELARQLNKIADLDSIDRVVAFLSSRERSLKAEAEVVEKRLVEAREGRKALDWVADADAALKSLEKRQGDLRKVDEEIASIEKLVREASDVAVVASRLLPDLTNLDELYDRLEKAKADEASLETVLLRAIEAQDFANRPIPDTSGLDDLWQRLGEAEREHGELDGLVTSIRATEGLVRERSLLLSASEKRLKKETGGRCPICGGELR